MDLLFFAKLLVVLFFLAMFIRGSRLVWGVGLLTVTTALLLDSFRLVFGDDSFLDEVGYFQDILRGVLFGGAALWLWGVLRPLASSDEKAIRAAPATVPLAAAPPTWTDNGPAVHGETDVAIDRQMLYEQIRYQLGPSDVSDLLFDLRVNENDIIVPNEDVSQLVVRLMNLAERRGQMGELALAVERVLTPWPAERLPRLEKLSADSPPAVLRYYLLAHYNLEQLQTLSERLEIDWEELPGSGKKEKVRHLLLYLYRRNRIADLIEQMNAEAQPVGSKQ